MKKTLLAVVAITLTGCSSSASIDGDIAWSVPLELTDDQFTLMHAFSIADSGKYVTVAAADGVVRSFAIESGEVTVERDTSAATACTALATNVLCTPVDWTTAQAPFVVNPETGESFDYAMTIGGLGEFEGRDIIQRSTATGFELVAFEPDTAVDDYERGGEVIAVFDADGERHVADQALFDALVEAGIAGSSWSDADVIPGTQQIADGAIAVTTNAQGTLTTVQLLDGSGATVDEWEIAASLHMSVNPRWTASDVTASFDKAVTVAKHSDHVAIFSGGEVEGLTRVLTDSVAPAYSWIEGFRTASGSDLDFAAEVDPGSLVLWVVDYPYIGVNGTGDDGAVATTFNIVTGETLVRGAKCQWTGGTYCFDGETLSKIEFSD